MFVSGEPLSHALEQIRVQLERKNRRKIEKIAGLRDEEKEEMEERERRVRIVIAPLLRFVIAPLHDLSLFFAHVMQTIHLSSATISWST